MSTFGRLGNLARGLFKSEVRKWTDPATPVPDEVEALDARRAERTAPRPTRESSRAASAPAPAAAPKEAATRSPTPARSEPERDENGEIKRTL